MGYVIVDADCEMILRIRLLQFVENGLYHRRREFLRRKSISATGYARGSTCFSQRRDHVEIHRLAYSAGLFGTVQHRDAFGRLRQRLGEVLDRKWPVQPHFEHAHLFAVGDEAFHRLFDGACARAHDHNHALRIGRTNVVEEVISPARSLREAIHHVLHNRRARAIERIGRLARLKENVRILSAAAQHRPVRIQRPITMLANARAIHQGRQVCVRKRRDLIQLVRSAEPIKEMHKRYARFERGSVRDER